MLHLKTLHLVMMLLTRYPSDLKTNPNPLLRWRVIKTTNMTQRIAPNNQLPATHFVEVWKYYVSKEFDMTYKPYPIEELIHHLEDTIHYRHKTIAIFRIRENKLPTKHKF